MITDHIGDLLESWQGGLVTYAENQVNAIKEALIKYEQTSDTKAACVPSLSYSSGQVCPVTDTLLPVRPDDINSFRLSSYIFTMGLLLRKYSTISWRYLLPEEMCPRDHSLTSF